MAPPTRSGEAGGRGSEFPVRTAAVALGSNLGDRASHLAFAVDELRLVLSDVVVSTFIQTPPEHDAPQPSFLNGALVGLTRDAPNQLLLKLLEIERRRGRVRSYPGAPRTLDLDLLLVGAMRVESEMLRLPHPRFRSRAFVLEPLAEIAPSMVDPVTGLSVRALLERLRRGE
jgi:2-amino-4-hydroxy-6-hydroxymethyldihydropteridine diphosphokinase